MEGGWLFLGMGWCIFGYTCVLCFCRGVSVLCMPSPTPPHHTPPPPPHHTTPRTPLPNTQDLPLPMGFCARHSAPRFESGRKKALGRVIFNEDKELAQLDEGRKRAGGVSQAHGRVFFLCLWFCVVV